MDLFNNNNLSNEGRINISNYNGTPFELFQNLGVNNNHNFGNSIKTMFSETPLSNSFFSRENIDYIQKHIIYGVYLASAGKYKIGKQSETELQIIMRSIYLQNSKNVPCNITDQVKALNKPVIQYCIKNIMTQVQQYVGYVDDVSNPRRIIEMPQNTSTAGQNTLQTNLGNIRFQSREFS